MSNATDQLRTQGTKVIPVYLLQNCVCGNINSEKIQGTLVP